jgi:hypothetical protein
MMAFNVGGRVAASIATRSGGDFDRREVDVEDRVG